MSYFDGMQAEFLRGIHKQMKIKNQLEVLKESYELGIIDRETYAENLRVLYEQLK